MQFKYANIKYKIWIVDDDADNHFLLNTAIKRAVPNVLVRPFNDGIEVIERLSQNFDVPDLIFLDLYMGLFGGREVLKSIRNSFDLVNIPVVILSGSEDPKDRDELISLGASAYLMKPPTHEELEASVRKITESLLLQKQTVH